MHTPGKLPPIGARIIKSSLGALICVGIYFIRELLPIGSGIPFYSILAVLWCIQPYTNSTLAMAKQRTIGTFLGAAFGLVFLLVFRAFGGGSKMLVYSTACLMLIPILYTTVLLEKRNASYFSCVVFLTISINHGLDGNPYLFVFNRVLDTLIGIGVGVLLNSFHRPIRHKENILYVSGIDSVLVSSKQVMIPYNKVELNRLIEEGIRFTISTIRTPASMLEPLSGINLKLPVIAMDGAVLYDIRENRYLDVFPLEPQASARAEAIIEGAGDHVFVNVLRDNTLLIYYGTFRNDAERAMFSRLRRSPYRNYTGKQYRRQNEGERVIYLMTLTQRDHAQELARRLREELGNAVRVVVSPASEYQGYAYLKVYSSEACKANMLEKLRQRVGAERVITFGSIPGQYDVYIHDDGGNSAVKLLKKLSKGESSSAAESIKPRPFPWGAVFVCRKFPWPSLPGEGKAWLPIWGSWQVEAVSERVPSVRKATSSTLKEAYFAQNAALLPVEFPLLWR